MKLEKEFVAHIVENAENGVRDLVGTVVLGQMVTPDMKHTFNIGHVLNAKSRRIVEKALKKKRLGCEWHEDNQHYNCWDMDQASG
jgi:hypothetical protein